MNALMKNCFRIAGIAVLTGVILVAVAFSIDNTIFYNWENFNISIGDNIIGLDLPDNRYNSRNDDWNGFAGNRINEKAGQEIPDQGVTHQGTSMEGISDQKSQSTLNSSDNRNNIKSIFLDISYGTVTIKEGEYFDIKTADGANNIIHENVSNGVWEISDANDLSGNESNVSIFGFNITEGGNPFQTTDIELTIPEDFKFENLDIALGAGTIKADNLIAENADINVGAGSLRIKSLTAESKSLYSIDTGELVIDDLTASNANINCGVGKLKASGIINGDSYVTCGIGNVELDIDGEEEDFNYKVDCGIGTVIINNNKYSGVNARTRKNNDSDDSFTLDCGIGKISLKIN
jgi:hypothetical protein